jgi:glycosyltransferase involved in cell wall biosynthesis
LKPKFIILHNGLKDLCGHYFETSISIAEAARRAGLHTVLATHVDCPADLFPDWLEVHRIFTTDHWMNHPPAAPPELGDAARHPYRLAQGVRRHRIAWRRWAAPLLASLDALLETVALRRCPRGWESLFHRGWWACRKAAWCVERGWFYLPPPFVYDTTLWLGRRLACLRPRILRPDYRERIGQRLCQRIARFRNGALLDQFQIPSALLCGASELARGLRHKIEAPYIAEAWRAATDRDLGREIEYGLVFRRDLERLLALADAGAEDQVLLNTAHARELLAVHLVSRRLGPRRSPTFHLVFRHPLFHDGPSAENTEDSPLVRPYATFLRLYDQWGSLDNIQFHTDTEELANEYGSLAPLDYGVLPIPFRAELIDRTDRSRRGPIRLVYTGEARDEKGFHWLPGLIEDLWAKYVLPGKVRFLIQATLTAPQFHPKSALAIEKLRKYAPEHVELRGLGSPLTPREYYALVSDADAIALPYDRRSYWARSSGTLAEALSAGCPAIVPAQTWMARQLPHGGGETFDDYHTFLQAVRRVIDGFDSYRRQAEGHKANWRARHSPDALVAAIVGSKQTTDMAGFPTVGRSIPIVAGRFGGVRPAA